MTISLPQSHLIALANSYLEDENTVLARLLPQAKLTSAQLQQAQTLARILIQDVRNKKLQPFDINQLLQTYQLNTEEGVALMCVAEALLRIPDAATKDALIRDKITMADWHELPQTDSSFSNFTNWALRTTGKVLDTKDKGWNIFARLVSKLGEPVIRLALAQAMKLLGDQFVLAEDIESAIRRGARWPGYYFSYDMLGEGARTAHDAAKYMDAYRHAIHVTGANTPKQDNIFLQPSVSVKLSALHPRYDWRKKERIDRELFARILELCELAKSYNIGITIDAEESYRLIVSLEIFQQLLRATSLKDYNGIGLAVQAYSKRALPTLQFLADEARILKKRVPIRLVKGAYWDTEIKYAQIEGHADYPVFTRKAATDVSYQACAAFMLDNAATIYPQFATHNALTITTILTLAGTREFELQRLHGMGDDLYDTLPAAGFPNLRRRIYAPVGPHENLLAYLVRRLLENGANSSFVYQIADKDVPITKLAADPVTKITMLSDKRHPHIPLPPDIYGARKNARGMLLSEPLHYHDLMRDIHQTLGMTVNAAAIIDGYDVRGKKQEIRNPANHYQVIGTVITATERDIKIALKKGADAQPDWDWRGGAARAAILEKAADLFEQNAAKLIGLVCIEGGRTIPNAISELREAIDFLRYYADHARCEFSHGLPLPGPTGERNELWLRGRGVFACIAPWNFPLAIFVGQVAAALAAGNAVLAKPAGQTPLIGHTAISLLHEAGVPKNILHFVPGSGRMIGDIVTASEYTAGIAFTGSTQTAQGIYQALAQRGGPIVPLIAETGGQNAMLVDSSALLEQACDDIIASAFDSSGQRCSALRVLFVQHEIADDLIAMLKGATAELTIGDPLDIATDVGPVIDAAARDQLEKHIVRMKREAKFIDSLPLPDACANGSFVAPHIFEIKRLSQLPEEVFGPILHIIRYKRSHLKHVAKAINLTGFGLTFGVHSRIDETHEILRRYTKAGNFYINRNMIGAVVGTQPFGGEGLSGTGPKAGGPHYLHHFALERTVTINITAAGGNARLLDLSED